MLRVENAGVSYYRYLAKLFLPVDLAVFYPYPGGWPAVAVISAAALVLVVSVFAVAARRRAPFLPFGWILFLGMLVATLGLVQVGAQSLADRYTFLPSIGLFVLVTWGASEWAARIRLPAYVLGAAAAAALSACAMLTVRQIGYWAGSETLFRHALAVTENNWLAHADLGNALAKIPGRLPEAIAEYEAGLRLRPENSEAHLGLANALAEIPGRLPESIGEYEAALRLKPDDSEAEDNLGIALSRTPGRESEAITHYEEAIRLDPDGPDAHFNLGNALANSPSRRTEAIAQYEAALTIKPDDPEAHTNLGNVLSTMPSRLPEAIGQYEAALRLDPGDLPAHFNLGLILANTPGRRQDAVAHLEASLRIRPDFEPARRILEQLRVSGER